MLIQKKKKLQLHFRQGIFSGLAQGPLDFLVPLALGMFNPDLGARHKEREWRRFFIFHHIHLNFLRLLSIFHDRSGGNDFCTDLTCWLVFHFETRAENSTLKKGS